MRKTELMHHLFGAGLEKCAGCTHLIRFYNRNKAYTKCSVYGITHSSASDWSGNYQSCGLKNKQTNQTGVIRLVTQNKEIIPLEGQMKME